MKKVYCDISATTPISNDVAELMFNIQRDVFGNPSSIHKYGQESHVVIEKARMSIANRVENKYDNSMTYMLRLNNNDVNYKGELDYLDGGILMIEDTHCSYIELYNSSEKFSFINFAKKIVDDVNFTYPLDIGKK